MGKIIRLTESELIFLVKKIINEQSSDIVGKPKSLKFLNWILSKKKGPAIIMRIVNRILTTKKLTNKPIQVPGNPFYKATPTKNPKWIKAEFSLIYQNSRLNSINIKNLNITANFLLTVNYSSNLSGDFEKDLGDTIIDAMDNFDTDKLFGGINEQKTKGLSGVQKVSATCNINADYTITKSEGKHILNIQPTSILLTSTKLEIPNSDASIQVVNNEIRADLGTFYGVKAPVLNLGNIKNLEEVKNLFKNYTIDLPNIELFAAKDNPNEEIPLDEE